METRCRIEKEREREEQKAAGSRSTTYGAIRVRARVSSGSSLWNGIVVRVHRAGSQVNNRQGRGRAITVARVFAAVMGCSRSSPSPPPSSPAALSPSLFLSFFFSFSVLLRSTGFFPSLPLPPSKVPSSSTPGALVPFLFYTGENGPRISDTRTHCAQPGGGAMGSDQREYTEMRSEGHREKRRG